MEEYTKSSEDATMIDILNNTCLIFGYLFWLFATIGLKRASGSKTLLRNLIISFVILILVVAALLIITPLIANWLINNRDWDTTLYIMFVGFVITAFIFLFFFYYRKEKYPLAVLFWKLSFC